MNSVQVALLTNILGFQVDSWIFSSRTGKLREEEDTLCAVARVGLSQFGLLLLEVALEHSACACWWCVCYWHRSVWSRVEIGFLSALLRELPSIYGAFRSSPPVLQLWLGFISPDFRCLLSTHCSSGGHSDPLVILEAIHLAQSNH